jgi:chromosome segregation ATPase
MIHGRLKKETIERLKKAKSRFHSTSYDDVINKALDFLDGKEARKLQEKINGLRRKNNDLEAVNLERREENRKLIEEKKPLEDKIKSFNEEMEKKNGELKAKDKEHETELAKINGEVVSLQNDIEYHWKPLLAQLSKDKLFEENQYLKSEIGKKNTEIDGKNERIDEVEKLIKITSSEKEDIINTVLKTFRDCKQFIPSMNEQCKLCVEGLSLEQYGKNVLKSIINLEGYLNTCKNHDS